MTNPLPLVALLIGTIVAAACGSIDNGAEPIVAGATVVATSEPASTGPSEEAAGETTAGAPDTSSTDAPTSTPEPLEPPEAPGVAYRGAGPFEVGVTTLELDAGNLVEVLYPATDAAAGATDAYRVRDFLPVAVAALIPADTPDSFEVAAQRDAAPSVDGPFPLVLFSHGSSAFRSQSSDLLRHLASWGMVVAAPDHPTRDLVSRLGGGAAEGAPDSVTDLRATRALIAVENGGEDVLGRLVDTQRVALAGHSAGGGTILAMAQDPGVAGYISYASGAGDGSLPDVPSLYLAGANDTIIEPGRTADAFRAAPNPSWSWTIDGAGHLAFSDLCTIGDGNGGLIGLAEAAGIGELVPENLRRLATDGCEPPNLPVRDVWPATNHASVAFLRNVFGIDAEPQGLDTIDLEDVTIQIDSK